MTGRKTRGTLSDTERKLWQKVTENITTLDSNRVATPLVRKSAYGIRAADRFGIDYGKVPARGLVEQSFMHEGADHNWHQRLRRGKVKPDGRIDLHGMSEDRAFAALNRYIEQAYGRGKRFILVITGKGGTKSEVGHMSHTEYERGRGILKTNVPRWLSQGHLATRIVSYYSANAEHGGDGALYVILKRNRG